MAVLLLISMPLFNNHASLFGYTELLALALILVTFLNVICYLRTDRPSWLFFAVLSGAGLFYTRNTGPLFAIAAVLPLILWGPRKAITVVFALVGLAAVVTLAFGVEKSPPNLAYHNGLLQGNVENVLNILQGIYTFAYMVLASRKIWCLEVITPNYASVPGLCQGGLYSTCLLNRARQMHCGE